LTTSAPVGRTLLCKWYFHEYKEKTATSMYKAKTNGRPLRHFNTTMLRRLIRKNNPDIIENVFVNTPLI
jgi:hypothetical protein